MSGPAAVAACLKWVDTRPEVDPLTGGIVHDPRSAGLSQADEAALEWALRIGEAWGRPVLAVTVGPVEAESVLRQALASGASAAIRVDTGPAQPGEAGLPSEPGLSSEPGPSSATVAASLAAALPADLAVAVCGNWSLDRGSGSVPAFLAAQRGAAQALGLISLSFGSDGEGLRAERRLDGGRRELLSIPLPAVVSVEGGSARLRRAPLAAVLEARSAPLTVVGGPRQVATDGLRRAPYRPRARVRPAPRAPAARDRILELTGALSDPTPPQRLVLEPPEAAARLLDQLRAWGYLE